MPNHVANRIELIGTIQEIDLIIKSFGEEIPATLSKTHDNSLVICNKKGSDFDFCWLDLNTGKSRNRGDIDQFGLPEGYEPEINQGYLMFPSFEKVIPPPDDPAYRDEPTQDVAKKSPNWWYNWNIENWGTKWGAYSFKREAINVFYFETAWSSVPLIVSAISKAFPEVTIIYKWADEDSGYNCGVATYKNGLLKEVKPDGGSIEAYDIYFDLHPESRNDYKLVGDTYEYVEQRDEQEN